MTLPTTKEGLISESIAADIASTIRYSKSLKQAVPFKVEIPIPAINIAGWLSSQKADQKFYWQNRSDDFEIGAFGSVLSLSGDESNSAIARAFEILREHPQGDLLFLSGGYFDKSGSHGSTWRDFSSDLCLVPEWMAVRKGSDYFLNRAVLVKEDADPESVAEKFGSISMTKFSPSSDYNHEGFPNCLTSRYLPDFAGWRENVLKSLGLIGSGKLDKVVLARRNDFLFDGDIDPFLMLSRLSRCHSDSYQILFQPRPGSGFVSVTPELLYRRENRHIRLEALSSTVIRGDTEAEDQLLAKYLMQSDKERREHQIVIDGLEEDLVPVIDGNPKIGETTVLKLDRIQHLKTSITGKLSPDIYDDQIIRRLHPSPAVAGRDRQVALDLIREIEPFPRGWYAGPVGYISRERSEFAVAIRSVHIDGPNLSGFAGAGIVPGSEPEAEWRELNNKDVLNPIILEKGSG